MRHLVLAAFVISAASGCDRTSSPPSSWTLMVDDATLDAVDHDGQPWCADGSDPAVAVEAAVGSADARSVEATGLTPSWRQPLLVADLTSFRNYGITLQVWVRCGTTTTRAGAAVIHPAAATVEQGGIALSTVGNVQSLRLRFVPVDVGGPDDPGATYVGDDPGIYEGYDPGYDDGWAAGDYGDDGSGDYGDSGDDGSGDYGDSGDDCGCSSDPGDTGGDYGGDDGSGDYGGDSGDSGDSGYRRLPGAATPQRTRTLRRARVRR